MATNLLPPITNVLKTSKSAANDFKPIRFNTENFVSEKWSPECAAYLRSTTKRKKKNKKVTSKGGITGDKKKKLKQTNK